MSAFDAIDCLTCGRDIQHEHVWWLACTQNDDPSERDHVEHCFSFCDECVGALATLIGGELEPLARRVSTT